MAYFHFRCGERITLQNENCTAVRNYGDFDNGIVVTGDPLANDVLFEIKIDKKIESWSGSLEIGVTESEPLNIQFPSCASKLQNGAWIMSGNAIIKDGVTILETYGLDLDTLNQDDRVGVMKSSEGELIFYVNGESLGIAAADLPSIVYGVVDLYGKCVQVTITSPLLRENNNDDCLSGSSVLAIDNDMLTIGGDISELSLNSTYSLDVHTDMNVSSTLPEESPISNKLRFHERCGSLIKLSNSQRTGERRRPSDEFNNGVVMTHRALRDSEFFEIQIDRLIDKWSGSIEMGITTHDPSTLVFPATMTNMRSGTIMMSGCRILTNGKGTRREYGDFNLDELSEGDRVGMMRKPDGNFHYFINGLDQGIAAELVPDTVWGVIDLYGMTVKVSIVERDEPEEENLMPTQNIKPELMEPQPTPDYYDRLTFHPNCGSNAQVINYGRTSHRPKAADDFNNGVVLTSRPIKTGEMFEVRLERIVTKWAGSIEIGVTTHSPTDLEFPFTMTNVRSGTWMMTGSGIMHNGTTVLEQYGENLDRLQVGDRVGVVRKDNGLLHFYVNGADQGTAAANVPDKIFGVIDLYGQAVEATIVDTFDSGSPDTIISSLSNTTSYSDFRFNHIHGRNATIINNGLTAWRPQPLAEFNDGIVFSNRPLRENELFEVTIDSMVDRWSGSIEIGLTAVRPDDIELQLPSTATDLSCDTWMLSGSSVMENGITIKSNYSCNLDSLGAGVRIGVMHRDKGIEFFKDGVSQGFACTVKDTNLYAVVDLYGQCAQVSIPGALPIIPISQTESCSRSDTSASSQATSAAQPTVEPDLHRFSDLHGKGVTLSEGGRVAIRNPGFLQVVVYSATPLALNEFFEVSITVLKTHLSGGLFMGVTPTAPNALHLSLPPDSCYLAGEELRYQDQVVQSFGPSLYWLQAGDRVGILRMREGLKAFINGEEIPITFPELPETLYVCMDLRGACAGISVLSRRPTSPLATSLMQDSLELVLDQEPSLEAPIASEEITLIETVKEEVVVSPRESVWYEIHDNHGRNIEIMEDKTIARRVTSYNQGIVFIQPPLVINQLLQITIEEINTRWQTSLIVGIVCGPPDTLNLPVTAILIKGPCCVVTNDWISLNGVKLKSNYGQRLNDLVVGSTVGLMLMDDGLRLIIDNVDEGVLQWIPAAGKQCYAVFELYGQCQKIKILNGNKKPKSKVQNFEKPDVVCEKTISNNIPLQLLIPEAPVNLNNEPVPSTSAGINSGTINDTFNGNLVEFVTSDGVTIPSNTDTSPNSAGINENSSSHHTGSGSSTKVSPTVLINLLLECPYQQECIKFKKRLFLPDKFFTDDIPICYCSECYRCKSHMAEILKDESLIGWTKFPLRNLRNLQTDNWHTAYYATKLGTIRDILDTGQLISKRQMQHCNLLGRRADDILVFFCPSMQQCSQQPFKLDDTREGLAVFEILVKPGAYTVIKDDPEWSTKEVGVVYLQALLLQLRPC